MIGKHHLKLDMPGEFSNKVLQKCLTTTIRFFSMFWGREDVYARRGKNGGYFPQCANRWNDRLCPKQRKEKVFCDECENTKWISLDVKK